MENINFILCIIYLILGILNIFGQITIENSSVFGMTVGTLFVCLAQLFDTKWLKTLMWIFAAGFIIGFPMLNEANNFIKDVDNNTWLLLSLSITFLSNFLNNVNNDSINIEKKNKELNKKLEKINKTKDKLSGQRGEDYGRYKK